MSRLTKMDAGQAVAKLIRAGYAIPKDAGGTEGVVDSWLEFLGDLGHDDISAAVDQFIRESDSDYWPKPKSIRALVREARAGKPGADPMQSRDLAVRYRGWELRENQHDGTGCPVCGAVLQHVASEYGRLFVLHDAREHDRQQIPHFGLPHPRWARDMYEAADRIRTEREAKRERMSPAAWKVQQAAQMDAAMKRVGDMLGGNRAEAAD